MTYHLQTHLTVTERVVIQLALNHAKGSRKQAAHLLGICLRSLQYKLRAHGLAKRCA